MLTRTTRIQLVVFAVIAVVVLAYTGFHYANLGRTIGLRGYYTVQMDLSNAGGIFPNGDVTYRGVSVGRVFEMMQGADLNVKLAEKELVCLTCWNCAEHKTASLLGPFVQALFDDLFVRNSFQGTRNVIEQVEHNNHKEFEALAELREALETRKLSLENQRDQKYLRMGAEVKRAACH